VILCPENKVQDRNSRKWRMAVG